MAQLLTLGTFGKPSTGDVDITQQVKMLEDSDPFGLETQINAFLASLPLLANNAVAVTAFAYSSAQLKNNEISYTMLISYFTYG